MLNATVLYLLGWVLLVLTGLMLIAALCAVIVAEWGWASNFVVDICITGFVAGALIIGAHGRTERLGRQHTIWLLLLIWIALPLAAAQPLMWDPQIATFSDAVFEASSALTTTGSTLLESPSETARTILFWRALLQWLGGALALLIAVLVLAPFGVLSTPINITIPGYEKDDLAGSLVATAQHIFPAYGLLTGLCMFLLWVLGVPLFEAICLAFATVSTGGMVPVDGGIATYNSLSVEIILMVFMFAGATSFLSHRATLLRLPGTHADNKETWYLAILIAVFGLVLMASFAATTEADVGSSVWVHLRHGLFRAVSLLTTTGFDNAPAFAPAIPLMVVCAACIIGGAAFSTASGLKVFRFVSMITQAHRELKRLIHPRSVSRAHSVGKPIDIQVMKAVWAQFFVFLVTVCAVAIVLGIEGVEFDGAIAGAIAAISNAGPAVALADFDLGLIAGFDYGALTVPAKWALIVGMILGRVEFVVIISLGFALLIRR